MLRLLIIGLLLSCEGSSPGSCCKTCSSNSKPCGDSCSPASSESGDSSGVVTTGDSSSGDPSTRGESTSASTGAEVPAEVCLEAQAYSEAGDGDVYGFCSIDCNTGCPVDPLHVEAGCVSIQPDVEELPPVPLCMATCKSDGWCAKTEICVAFFEGSFCVPADSQV